MKMLDVYAQLSRHGYRVSAVRGTGTGTGTGTGVSMAMQTGANMAMQIDIAATSGWVSRIKPINTLLPNWLRRSL